jgi:hypothetical protein
MGNGAGGMVANYKLLKIRCKLTSYSLLPITYYQLPITYYQLPITNYQLPITYYLLPITGPPLVPHVTQKGYSFLFFLIPDIRYIRYIRYIIRCRTSFGHNYSRGLGEAFGYRNAHFFYFIVTRMLRPYSFLVQLK